MEKANGLKPSEILFLPDAQKRLVNFLSRNEHANFKEIQQALGMDHQETYAILSDLKELGYVNESLHEGEVHYRVKFVVTTSRAKNNFPSEFWDALNPDVVTFLHQVPGLRNYRQRVFSRAAGKNS